MSNNVGFTPFVFSQHKNINKTCPRKYNFFITTYLVLYFLYFCSLKYPFK